MFQKLPAKFLARSSVTTSGLIYLEATSEGSAKDFRLKADDHSVNWQPLAFADKSKVGKLAGLTCSKSRVNSTNWTEAMRGMYT